MPLARSVRQTSHPLTTGIMRSIGRLASRDREGVGAIGGGERLVTLEAQVVLETAYDLRLVVHDEDARHAP